MINVVLYEPEIPQNTGNIMRTCAGTGVKLHLIKPLGFSLDENSIKRSGANYIDSCDFYFLTRYGTKTHTDFDYSDTSKNIYLVFGRESTGIPKEILKKHLDTCLRIPTNDSIRALNLSNCVAIMVYEVLRQQDYPNLLRYDTFKGENYLEE